MKTRCIRARSSRAQTNRNTSRIESRPGSRNPGAAGLALLALALMSLASIVATSHAQTPPQFRGIQALSSQETFLSLSGTAGTNYELQSSADHANWSGWRTLAGTNSDPFGPPFVSPTNALFLQTDPGAPYATTRFYRAVQSTGATVVSGDHLATGVGEFPESVTADSSGNVYMSILPLSKIKKITPDGVATDFAQIPGPGVTVGLKLDAVGNIYIVKRGSPSDTGIWKVTPTGVATLYASIPGSQGLNDLVLDNQGNLYVTDSSLGYVYKVDPTGQATVWKSDPLLQPQSSPPVPFPLHPGPGANGLVFNLAKTVLYVMNTTVGSILQVAVNSDGSAGALTTLVQDNSLVGGDGITLDAGGNIIVGNNAYSRVLRVTPLGNLTKLIEGGLIDISSSVTFVPGGDANTLYVCNFGIPLLGGNPAYAGLLKLDLTSMTLTPVAYFNQDVVIHPILHASVLMSWAGKIIYCDPSSSGGHATASYAGYPAADLILVTHLHGDHFNTNVLAQISSPTTHIVAPPTVFQLMSPSLQALTTVLTNGMTTNFIGASIEAIPAYNTTSNRLAFHPKGRDNGYVLTLSGKRLYFSSDTEDIPEMRALTNIDVAFICMNLPFTMDINQASSAVRAFKPRIVYPDHFNGAKVTATGAPDSAHPVTSDVEEFKRLAGTDLGIEVRLRDWYPPLAVGDRLTTSEGDVVIHPIHHASTLLECNGEFIYNDPVLGGTAPWQGYPLAGLILIGHVHPDHFDTNSLETLKGTNTVIIAPESVFTNMPPDLQAITLVLTNSGPGSTTNLVLGAATTNAVSLSVEAIPAYNIYTNRLGFHPQARGDNGYVLTISDKRLYFSGDTDDTPEMRALTNVDVAFVCMNPVVTMDASQAASAVRQFQPAVVYPYHFVLPTLPFPGPDQGTMNDVRAFKQLVGTDLPIEVRIRQGWYAGFE